MKKVLLSQEIHKDAMNFLKDKNFHIIISESPEDEIVRKYAKDADAIIVRTATRLSRTTIFYAEKLKVIARTGAGVDNIDINAASERNIPVCNTPEANIDSVAEHTVAFMLALSKCIFKMDRAVREGNFAIRNRYLPVDLQNKILGLVGFGRIGKSVAQICSICFNMKIIFYDPFLNNDIKLDFNADRVYGIEEIFMRSDYISLHIPYNSQNHHLIDINLLKKMKPDSFLVNTSRGGIICENALAECLISGRIAGAALDVFEDEPPESDSPLLKIDNVILSPHSAALTREGSKRIAMHAVQGVADVLEGKIPKWIFNRNNIKLL